MRQATQKYSACIGSGSARHREQTGTRETSRKTSPQRRHSSGKIELKRAQEIFSAMLAAPAGHAIQLLLGSSLLEKTHLHRTPPVYNARDYPGGIWKNPTPIGKNSSPPSNTTS